jgi:rhomboid protease GluP
MSDSLESSGATMPAASPTPRWTVQLRSYAASGFLTAQPKTQWRWKGGAGELRIEGDEVVLNGRRARTLLPSSPQEIRFPLALVRDLKQTGNTVKCVVALPHVKPEPLIIGFADEAAAADFAERCPTDRLPASVDKEAFDQALAQLGTRVVVTPTLIGLNVAVFAAMTVAGINVLQPLGPELLAWGSNYGPKTLNGEPWRLFTSMFLHFGILHLAFNMWALWSMGPLAERLFGNLRFGLLYIVAGLAGSLASLWWHDMVHSAGASGAIFGVIGALLAFFVNPQTKVPPTISKAQRNSALAFVAYNLLNGFSHAGIDNAAHLGGLLAGFGMGWLLARPLTQEARKTEHPGLTVGTLAGLAALLLMAWPVFLPGTERLATRHFEVAFLGYADIEEKALAKGRELEALRKNTKVSDLEWANRVREEALPLWKNAADYATAIEVPTGSHAAEAKSALVDYVASQQELLRLVADLAVVSSPGRQKRLKEAQAQTNTKVQRAIELIKGLR